MNCGTMEISPQTSPTSPSAFLPSFLLGETEVSEEVKSRIGRDSFNNSVGFRNMTPTRADINNSRGAKSRLNGPPTQSLFDENDSPQLFHHNNSVSSPNFTSLSLANRSGAETSFKDEDGLWVVVYGFTPAAASHILNMFSQCGRVTEHSSPPNGGNWMMIRYEDRTGVRKALSFNTRVVAGNLMLGVSERKRIPELRMTDGEREHQFNMSNTSISAASPISSPRVRHLGPSKQPLARIDELTPRKDNSVMTRAMDILFGW